MFLLMFTLKCIEDALKDFQLSKAFQYSLKIQEGLHDSNTIRNLSRDNCLSLTTPNIIFRKNKLVILPTGCN